MTSTLVRPAARAGAADHRPLAAMATAMRRLASWRVWLPVAAVYGAFAAVFFGNSVPFAVGRVELSCGQPPPDVRFSSSAEAVHAFLVACGPAGREAYRAMQLADLVYPLVFAVFMASSLAIVLSRLAPGRPVLALAALPFLASLFDYAENGFAWMALAAYPEPPAAAGLLGVASAAKTTSSWVAGILLLGGLGIVLVRAALRGTRPASTGRAGEEQRR